MPGVTLSALDDATRALVQLAAALATGSERDVRVHLQRARESTPHPWVEELILQTYLFAGFPRALNGMREWRRLVPAPVPGSSVPPAELRTRGEHTCAQVYGSMYDRLRHNIQALHPLLDDWMIEEGYGKVLSRPGLDLARRELCIMAACAASGQDRQLQSHLHGSQNAGVSDVAIGEALEALRNQMSESLYSRAWGLWERIRNDVH